MTAGNINKLPLKSPMICGAKTQDKYFLIIGGTLHIAVKKMPNRFHMIMQKIFFGFKYKEIS